MINRHQHLDLLPSFSPIRAFAAHEKNRVLWVWVLCVLALLYNPISRVDLDRTTSIGVNWFATEAIIIAAAVFWQRSRNCDRTE